MPKTINIHCLGVCTMDFISQLEHFPAINSKNKSLSMKMCGGGNSANVAFDLFMMMKRKENNNNRDDDENDENDENDDDGLRREKVGSEGSFQTIIKLISKIGNDVVGKSILKEFEELQDEKVRVDLSGLVVAQNCQSSFSYIMVTPSLDSKEAFDRTIVNTPLSEGFEFKELEDYCKEYNLEPVDLLFLDGRYSNVAIEYINEINCTGCIVMECERMRFGSELKCFLELISKSNVITLSEGFGKEYLEYYMNENVEIKEWLKGIDISNELISLHLLYSLLQPSINKIPNFLIQTLGSKGSLCMIKQPAHDTNGNKVKSLSDFIPLETISTSPQTTDFSFSILDHQGTQHSYTIIYCQAYTSSELAIIDSTGAGDSFNAATLYTLQNFIAKDTPIDLFCMRKLLKFSSISAVYCCSAVGARTRIIDSQSAERIWNEL